MGKIDNIDQNLPIINLKKTKSPPKIDGELNDPAWINCVSITDFKRYNIKEGDTPSEKTEVKVTYDENNLYFGIRCYDNDPKAIRANINRRDSIEGDDNVRIYLDTFNTKLRGYYFSVNPFGVQSDGYLNDGIEDQNRDFVFKSKGKTNKDGWVQEIAIPFKSLRFKKADPKKWRFLITRYIARKDESISWPPIKRKIMGVLPQAGEIKLREIKRGYGIDIIPYASGGYNWTMDNNEEKGEKILNFGGELRWGITSDLSLNITGNPDYAHLEADKNQISLNKRTELYYPEKRPFFLESSDIFASPINLLYTRRIINPLVGGKISGQIGKLGVGILSIYDRDKEGGATAIFNLARFKLDIMPQTYIGATIIDKEDIGKDTSGFYNRVVSLDGSANFLKNYRFAAQIALSYAKNKKINGNVPAYNIGFLRDDGTFSFNVWHEDYAPNFKNEAGYIPQLTDNFIESGLRSPGLSMNYIFRPENRWLKNWNLFSLNTMNFDYNNSLRDIFNVAEIDFNFEKNISFGLAGIHSTETFRDRTYSKMYFSAGGSMDTSKYFSSNFGLKYFGKAIKYDFDYYSDLNDQDDSYLGWKIAYGGGIQIRPLKRLNIELTFDNERFYEKLGEKTVYNAWVGGLKTSLQFTREAFFKSYTQIDTQKSKIDINALFGYMINPGTVFYLGYTDSITDVWGNARSVDRSIFAKASYLFSL